MPRYFFDFWEDGALIADDEGTDLPDDEAARDEAVINVSELAKEILCGDGNAHELTIVVRDAEGAEILKVGIKYEPA